MHGYVPDFDIDIGHVSGWRAMGSLPPVYRAELLASSISIFTTTFISLRAV